MKYVDPWGNEAASAAATTVIVISGVVVGILIVVVVIAIVAGFFIYRWWKGRMWKWWKEHGEIDIVKPHRNKIEMWDEKGNKIVVHIRNGKAVYILIIDGKGGHYTYWKDEDGVWHRHYEDKDEKHDPIKDVTDKNEIKKLEEYIKRAEEEWEKKYGDKSQDDQGDSSPDDSSGDDSSADDSPQII